MQGAKANVVLARQYYPGWECWFWVDETVPLEFIELLSSQSDCRILYQDSLLTHFDRLMWRFFSMDEGGVEIMIVRDTDSRINSREANAVAEWIKSGANFHIMRDHPMHNVPICGGMWGVRRTANVNFRELATQFLKNFRGRSADIGIDQNFLAEMIWPTARENCVIHDSSRDDLPFTDGPLTGDHDLNHVGRQFYPWQDDWLEHTPQLHHEGNKPTRYLNEDKCDVGIDEILIVRFNEFYDQDMGLNNLNFHDVHISSDRNLIPIADVVVSHVPETINSSELLPRKNMDQLWVCMSMESEINYPSINDECYDLNMTYQRDSDVWMPYFIDYEQNFNEKRKILNPKIDKGPGCLVASFISSPINKSERMEYLAELSEYIEIHHYGSFLNNSRLDNDCGRDSKLQILGKYKFAIAFENSICRDYVTEKFFDPLITNTVPVYMGAPNIDDYSPGSNSFINVIDFPEPRELAQYLKDLSEDVNRYSNYFSWQSDFENSNLGRMMGSARHMGHPFTRLVKSVRQKLATRGEIQFRQNPFWNLVKIKNELYLENREAGIQAKINDSFAAIWQRCESGETISGISQSLELLYPDCTDSIYADVKEAMRQIFFIGALDRKWPE